MRNSTKFRQKDPPGIGKKTNIPEDLFSGMGFVLFQKFFAGVGDDDGAGSGFANGAPEQVVATRTVIGVADVIYAGMDVATFYK